MPGRSSYSIEFTPAAQRALLAFGMPVRRRLASKIDGLAENPRPPGVKALVGELKGLYRLRVGDYRVLYQVKDKALVVLVVGLGNRREAYR